MPAPVGPNQAAEALGCSRRFLDEAIKSGELVPIKHYDKRGNRRVFYPEQIRAIRKAMTECASKSNGSKAGRMSPGPDLMGSASDALSKLVILAERRS